MRATVESPSADLALPGDITAEPGLHPLQAVDGLADRDLAALRQVLLARERAQIKKILQRLDDPATRTAELSRILPAALAIRGATDPSIEQALLPSVRGALGDALKERPELLLQAVRTALLDMIFTPWRSLGRKWRRWRTRRINGAKIPTQIERLYLVRRSDHILLEQAVRPPSATDDDGQVQEEERLLSSMVPYLLAFLRDPDYLGRYALMGHLRIERFTYGIHVGSRVLLLSVIRSPVTMLPVNQLVECQEIVKTIERDREADLDGNAPAGFLPRLGQSST